MTIKELIGTIAVLLTFLAYIPYYRDIFRGKTHPHIYSWALWGLLSVLLVILQIQGGAGPAVWVTIAAGMLCLGVVILSVKSGSKDVTNIDKVMAVLSLLAIAFWLLVKKPEVSIILVIVADMLAFFPTIRKSYIHPYSETLSLYVTNAIRFFLALLAIESYTFLSTAWILMWASANALFAIMLVIQRRRLRTATLR